MPMNYTFPNILIFPFIEQPFHLLTCVFHINSCCLAIPLLYHYLFLHIFNLFCKNRLIMPLLPYIFLVPYCIINLCLWYLIWVSFLLLNSHFIFLPVSSISIHVVLLSPCFIITYFYISSIYFVRIV